MIHLFHQFLHPKLHQLLQAAPLTALMAIGTLPAPAQAATVGTPQTVEFAPLTLDLECTFSGGSTAGTLVANTEKTQISTEFVGGVRVSYGVTTNFEGGQLVVDSLEARRDGTQFTPTNSTLYLSGNSTSATPSNSESIALEIPEGLTNDISVGIAFSPPSSNSTFTAGIYDAKLTLTCTK